MRVSKADEYLVSSSVKREIIVWKLQRVHIIKDGGRVVQVNRRHIQVHKALCPTTVRVFGESLSADSPQF